MGNAVPECPGDGPGVKRALYTGAMLAAPMDAELSCAVRGTARFDLAR